MRISICYPESREDFASALRTRLGFIRQAEFVWVSLTPADFTAEVEAALEDGDPTVLCLDSGLITKPTRETWQPVLERIEAGGAAQLAVLRLDGIKLPALLDRVRQAAGESRELTRWVMGWIGVEAEPVACSVSADMKERLLRELVDQPGTLQLDEAFDFAFLRPYFEYTAEIELGHESESLRLAALAEVKPMGRALYILRGGEAEAPAGASLLVLPKVERHWTNEELIRRAAEVLTRIPTQEGLAFAVSTRELEALLVRLFATNWALAERLARKAGAFFRLNDRVPEAVWAFETLAGEAAQQGAAACVRHCEEELYWLRAGGERKRQFLTARQTGFEF